LPEILFSIQERIQIENGALTITNLNVTDSGMFQCIAENKHGLIYSSAELKVVGKNMDFYGFILLSPLKYSIPSRI
jgi:hypothetical protein